MIDKIKKFFEKAFVKHALVIDLNFKFDKKGKIIGFPLPGRLVQIRTNKQCDCSIVSYTQGLNLIQDELVPKKNIVRIKPPKTSLKEGLVVLTPYKGDLK